MVAGNNGHLTPAFVGKNNDTHNSRGVGNSNSVWPSNITDLVELLFYRDALKPRKYIRAFKVSFDFYSTHMEMYSDCKGDIFDSLFF